MKRKINRIRRRSGIVGILLLLILIMYVWIGFPKENRITAFDNVSGDTVVVSDNAPAPAPAPTDEVEGQMKLEDWEEPPALGDDWQERLRRTRQEQMEDFERRREKAGGLKLSGEEEVNDPAEEPPAPTVEEPEEELEDYSRYEETAAVRGD